MSHFGKYTGDMPFSIGDWVVDPLGIKRQIVRIDRHVYPICLKPPTRRYKPEQLKQINGQQQ